MTEPFYYELGERDYKLYVARKLVFTGHQSDVRERIEELLETATDTRVSLQESSDEGYFQVYMHSDNEYLSQEDSDTLQTEDLEYEMSHDEQMEAIKKICNITKIKEVTYK